MECGGKLWESLKEASLKSRILEISVQNSVLYPKYGKKLHILITLGGIFDKVVQVLRWHGQQQGQKAIAVSPIQQSVKSMPQLLRVFLTYIWAHECGFQEFLFPEDIRRKCGLQKKTAFVTRSLLRTE